MWTKALWKDIAERAISTFGEVVLAIIGVSYLANPLVLLDINWLPVIIAGLIGSAIAVLKGLIASTKGDKNSASLVK